MKPGLSDDHVIALSIREQRIIITFDKDFGRLALHEPQHTRRPITANTTREPEYITQRVLSALAAIEDPYGKLIIVRRKTIKVISIR